MNYPLVYLENVYFLAKRAEGYDTGAVPSALFTDHKRGTCQGRSFKLIIYWRSKFLFLSKWGVFNLKLGEFLIDKYTS